MMVFESLDRVAHEGDRSDPEFSDMADFPSFDYTTSDVRSAGKIIASDMLWTDETEVAIRQAYAVANSWRDSHVIPMRSIRLSALYYLRGTPLVSAARLKRMQAIRGKLRRFDHLKLDKLQDLGGCRIILPTISDVQNLAGTLKTALRHEMRKEDDYIAEPKIDGYRSHHLIWRYVGRRRHKVLSGRSIELQVRTSLQHSWATTIEAVGLYRGEALKSRQGSEEWLRLFALMSADFAEAENCAKPDKTPDAGARRKEIRDLAKALDAVSVLETVSRGFAGPDIPLMQGYRPSHFLIRYDRTTRAVTVVPYNKTLNATRSYDLAEAPSNQTESDNETIVLVEVGKIDSLREAYPNYFGDVERFKTHLKEVVHGSSAFEFIGATRQKPRPPDKAIGDPSWLRGARFPKPDAVSRRPNKRE